MKNILGYRPKHFLWATLVLLGIVLACEPYYFRLVYHDANKLVHQPQHLKENLFMKAHMKNGEVCLFKEQWELDTFQNRLIGNGERYNINRAMEYKGFLSIPFDSISIYETNTKIRKSHMDKIIGLTVMVGLELALGIYCVTVPKACFGSCPTFYTHPQDNFHYSSAEAFTNAILPSMEYSDIDDLHHRVHSQDSFSLTMKNEALETHCVRNIHILAFPVRENESVYHSAADRYYLCEGDLRMIHSRAPEGDISCLLSLEDQKERFSFSNEEHLNTREELILEFDNADCSENLGLVLDFRQSLMTTYLFYSAMGYMGEQVGDVFALLENNPEWRKKFDQTTKLLGGIDVYVWNETLMHWVFQSTLNEAGPIAINRQLVPLHPDEGSNKVKVKLILNQGLWRLDYAAVTKIKREVLPVRIKPSFLLDSSGENPEALSALNDSSRYLHSYPGDVFTMNFKMPERTHDYALFLDSKGYYLEWMRAHWIQDKDLNKLKQMVLQPNVFLREQAKIYKQYEYRMESDFWNSRIENKSISYEK